MAYVDVTQNLPYLRKEITSGDPLQLDRYIGVLLRDLQYKLEQIADVVNLKIDKASDEVLTFTPVVAGSSTAGTGTYDTQVGIYTLLGKICWFTIQLEWDDANHTGTGDVTITGMPATSATTTNANLLFPAYDAEGGALFAGVAQMSPNSTTINKIRDSSGSAAAMNADHTLTITGMYRTT